MTITSRPATDADTDFARQVHHAAYRGHVEAVRFLLGKGADPNSECMWGTPLHLAAMCGSGELVLLFLELGLDVNAIDRGGRTMNGTRAEPSYAYVFRHRS